MGQFLHQLSLVQSSRSIQHMPTVPRLKHFVFSFNFCKRDQSLLHRPRNSGREFAWWTNSLVGQYLHQLMVSCTKSKIHLAHADSPMTRTFFSPSFFREDQSLLHRSTNSGRECVWWTNSLVGRYLHQLMISCTKFKIHLAHADSPMAETFFPPFNFLERTSLCFTDQET